MNKLIKNSKYILIYKNRFVDLAINLSYCI